MAAVGAHRIGDEIFGVADIGKSRMDEPSAEEIAARLTSEQGVIVLGTPESWREADALPDEMFDFDETYDPETAAETRFWVPTELGKQVQEIARAEPLKS